MMMKLNQLIKGVAINDFRGDREVEIKGLAYDSRKVKPGFLFIALRGYSQDGHDFVRNAVKNGAAALVVEHIDGSWKDDKSSILLVPDSRKALSMLAVNYYRSPFQDMNMIGITGTNGKTTTSYLLESILLAAGAKPGVVGTINYRLPGRTWKASVTTPESLDLMRILRKMTDAGVSDVIMEVSSHALDQGRTNGCPFRVAVFTNLSRDHLDYHGSMEKYFKAKSRLFLSLREKGPVDLTRAIINADDPKGKQLIERTDAHVLTYGLGKDCDVRAERVQVNRNGLTAKLISPAGEIDIRSSFIGDFNIYNILAASAAGISMNIDLNTVASGIERLKEIPGRLELVKNSSSLTVVVDYAHTPDALLKALKAVRSIVRGRLITVFGCGGDRDMGKRWEMGRVAGSHSDMAIITSDNPRTEDPAAIASQIEGGVREAGLKKVINIPKDGPPAKGYLLDLDRGHAIKRAIEMADEKDLILIAGKGHEDYQIVGEEKRYFDDRIIAAGAASGKI